LLQQHNIKEAE